MNIIGIYLCLIVDVLQQHFFVLKICEEVTAFEL